MRTFVIGNINPGQVRAEFCTSMVRAVQHDWGPDLRLVHFFAKHAGPYLDTERNNVVAMFNATDADVLLFVDSDLEFTPEDVAKVVAAADPLRIVGGAYYNQYPEGLCPVAYEWRHDDELGVENLKPITRTLTGLAEVDAVGTGFMAIHRDTLRLLADHYLNPTPWFAELPIRGIQMGEDLTFCCRAKALGVSVFVDMDVNLTHYKTAAVHPPKPAAKAAAA